MPFVDFAELKSRVTFEKAMHLLGLTLKQAKPNQWRGVCPVHGGGDRGLVVTEGKGFYCFGTRAGGDQIELVAHIKQIKPKDAAEFLAGTVQVTSTSSGKGTVPESEGEEPKKFQPLAYLEPEHMAVDAIGFCTDFAKKYGIGFAPRGTMKGYVLAPFRDEQGTLLGYIGLTPECKLPASFTPNVVDFKKTA